MTSETDEPNVHWLDSNGTETRFLRFTHGSEKLLVMQASTLGCGDFSASAVGFYLPTDNTLVPVDESSSPEYWIYAIFSYQNSGVYVVAETGSGKALFILDSSSLSNEEHEIHVIHMLLIQSYGCAC